MRDIKRIIAFNLGSTSTKIAYYENKKCIAKESISHSADVLRNMKKISDQYILRKETLLDFAKRNNITFDQIDCITTRGGMTEPIVSGVYRVNEAMIQQNDSGEYGVHICGLGLSIAYNIAKEYNIIAFTVDTPSTNEFEPLAFYSGMKEINRISSFQALNQKAMSKYYAETIGKKYNDINLITVMLGGGISVVAHKKGRMIDGPDALEGDGPFSNNRTGSLPVGQLIKLCYSGQYTFSEMMRKINGEGGLISYLGTTDIRAIEAKIMQGDRYSAEVIEAMCYQTAKDIGAYATVLKGDVDAILFTGGMANSTYITNLIKERVGFIAPVVIIPGEREMEALCISSYKALIGENEIIEFQPKEEL